MNSSLTQALTEANQQAESGQPVNVDKVVEAMDLNDARNPLRWVEELEEAAPATARAVLNRLCAGLRSLHTRRDGNTRWGTEVQSGRWVGDREEDTVAIAAQSDTGCFTERTWSAVATVTIQQDRWWELRLNPDEVEPGEFAVVSKDHDELTTFRGRAITHWLTWVWAGRMQRAAIRTLTGDDDLPPDLYGDDEPADDAAGEENERTEGWNPVPHEQWVERQAAVVTEVQQRQAAAMLAHPSRAEMWEELGFGDPTPAPEPEPIPAGEVQSRLGREVPDHLVADNRAGQVAYPLASQAALTLSIGMDEAHRQVYAALHAYLAERGDAGDVIERVLPMEATLTEPGSRRQWIVLTQGAVQYVQDTLRREVAA